MQGQQSVRRRLPPRTLDAALAMTVAVAMVLIVSVAKEPGSTRAVDAFAYLLGLTVAALLLLRRSRPMLVLVGSVGVVFIYAGCDYPAFSLAVPLAAAAYAAAVAGYLLPAATICAFALIAAVGWQNLFEGASLPSVIGTQALADASLLTAVLLLGEAVRHRRAWADEVNRRLEQVEKDREREAAHRARAERMSVARELHDVIAHTIAAVNVQAAVATDVLDDAPGQARASLETIRAQSRDAISELKATVALLRGEAGDAPRSPAPGLAVLDGLVGHATAAGLDVHVTISGDRRALPVAVDLIAYRIVQESLTNVVRHAEAHTATVAIGYQPDAIEIRVQDDGAGGSRNGAGHTGYGLIGMRERTAVVGGTFDAGPASGGGFVVRARLPTMGPIA